MSISEQRREQDQEQLEYLQSREQERHQEVDQLLEHEQELRQYLQDREHEQEELQQYLQDQEQEREQERDHNELLIQILRAEVQAANRERDAYKSFQKALLKLVYAQSQHLQNLQEHNALLEQLCEVNTHPPKRAL